MKYRDLTSKLSLAALASLALMGGSEATAGYPSYPPKTVNKYLVFEDSENKATSSTCFTGAPCVLAYYLPSGISLAKNERGVPMLSQGLFFSSTSVWNHRVVYNITLEPEMAGYDDLQTKVKDMLAAQYRIQPEQVVLSPLPVGRVQFVVRNTFGSADSNPGTLPDEPAPAPSASPSPGAAKPVAGAAPLNPVKDPKKVANTTHFTEFLTPDWTGSLHNLGARFSVSIRGPVWDLEPALQNMFLNEAGNAAVGTVSFSFPVLATPLKATYNCDVRKIQEVTRDTTKTWNITRISSPFYSRETFDNQEWNALRTQLRIQDFCKIESYQDTTIPQNEALENRQTQLFDTLFKAAFKAVDELNPQNPIGPSDAKYTRFESRSVSDAQAIIKISLDVSEAFNASSDLDFTAGGVTENNLANSHRVLCEKWERYDINKQKCVAVCEPAVEAYVRGPGGRISCKALDQVEVPHAGN